MKKTLIFLIGIAVALLMGCSENASFLPDDEAMLKGAKKPLPKLVGTTTEFFSPTTMPYIYMGTIDFSASGMGTYNLAYEMLEYTQKESSNAGFFTEIFYVFEGDNPDVGTVFLKGTNSGVMVGSAKFVSNGMVEEANGRFTGWEGRNVHVNGTVLSSIPDGPALELTSTFRVN